MNQKKRHINILPNRILKHTIFWIIIILFFTILPLTYGADFFSTLIGNLIYIPVDIIFTYFLIYFIVPKYLFKRNYFGFAISLCILYLACFGFSLIINIISSIPDKQFNLTQIPYKFFNTVLILTFIGGIASFYKISIYNQKIQADHEHMEKQFLQSELNLLRSQINPHFLFNTLNNIDEMIFQDKEKASRYIFLLSNIMRYMLSEVNKEFSFLKDEIQYIKDFLELSSYSFPHNNFINLEITGSVNQKKVPTLIFIPIIENAIKHSNKQIEDIGIEMKISISKSNISLKSENFIRTNHSNSNNINGFGLKNLEKRLDLIYGRNYMLKHTKTENKYVITFQIPFL